MAASHTGTCVFALPPAALTAVTPSLSHRVLTLLLGSDMCSVKHGVSSSAHVEGRRRHSIVLLLCVDDVYAGGLFLSEFRVVCYVPCGGHRFGTTEIGAAAARLTGPVAVPLCPGVLPPSEQDRLSNKQLAQVLIGVCVVYL